MDILHDAVMYISRNRKITHVLYSGDHVLLHSLYSRKDDHKCTRCTNTHVHLLPTIAFPL